MAYKNKDKYRDYQKQYKIKNRAKIREIERIGCLRRNFNLSREDYNNLLIKQNNRCALCFKPEIYKKYGRTIELAVDHDRKCCSGKKSCGKCIRGLLCANCNRFIIGYIERLKIDPYIIVKYLLREG